MQVLIGQTSTTVATIPAMSTAWEAVYTQQQRDAVAYAYEDRRIRPAKRVVTLAAAGELELNGTLLDPFEVNEDSVRHYARVLRKERAGQVTSQLSDQAPRDAVEQLRRRLVNVADAELKRQERAARKDGADSEKLRQIARAVREIAALPGPNDPAPPAPGAKAAGQRTGGETRGGIAGPLLAAHRAENGTPRATDGRVNGPDPSTAPDAQDSETHEGTHSTETTGTPANAHSTTHEQNDHEPGSLVSALAAAHGVQL
jgi:hypothetical protein